ncbi:FabD/lysophospholipase-like protein [Aureobasidium sp. EXF-12298]|nr:FabD/lysophospholipase-like protein [Aureobasidium sp. EXF-12298]KAI4759665.1 FabD/lysophospholipase-like protein [Aureobasidium sp. EXF-12344]KAI4778495.1 FabD/lysophospholipase-like protein [Aureobasidium sp. EXF-3400]
MADTSKQTDGPDPWNPSAWDPSTIPDFNNDFIPEDDVQEFAKALAAPDFTSPSEDDLLNPSSQPPQFFTALNDWAPVRQKVKGQKQQKEMKKKRPPRRGKDETREGWTYNLLKWPLLFVVLGWITALGISYMFTRLYIYLYEHFVTWRGKREQLRASLRHKSNYEDWIKAAKELDGYLGSDKWKTADEYAYYDSKTIRRVKQRLQSLKAKVKEEANSNPSMSPMSPGTRAVDELRGLVEACVKNNFAGFENPRLYSETYFGTKNLVQDFIDEASECIKLLLDSDQLGLEDKRAMVKHLSTNFGRTALCLSGGATFAYYHFGIAKALLDADLLPPIITGTSGGALVAALLGTRTNEELKSTLVPALAARITACREPFSVWSRRWYKTGARFDSIDWARRCSWFCHGSLTFLEAFQRTGRILNVSCVPSDPHSPTILANYLTAPDCVVWSAVLASAAVPGVLNPVVLMRKKRDGTLEPYAFGHKWKDGSLRTDIPLKALNLHFNVNFSIVSQVNPHINLFFFSSRGSVGRPVTHRRGRGWRGGFLGSALEQYLKLDLTKWLKVLRHLELLPRPMGQDWSEVWLQRFSGTITIWPRSKPSDFWHILADPSKERLAGMIQNGQQAAFPKLKFISNRMKIEKIVEDARQSMRPNPNALPTPSIEKSQIRSMLSNDDLESMLDLEGSGSDELKPSPISSSGADRPQSAKNPKSQSPMGSRFEERRAPSPSFARRFSGWFNNMSPRSSSDAVRPNMRQLQLQREESQEFARRGSVIDELTRQASVFFAEPETESEKEDEGEDVAPYGKNQRDWRDFGEGDTTASEDEAEAFVNGSQKAKTS